MTLYLKISVSSPLIIKYFLYASYTTFRHPFIVAVHVSRAKCLLAASRPSVRLYQRGSHWTDLRVRDFYENLSSKSKFPWTRSKIMGILHWKLSTFYWCRRRKSAIKHCCITLNILYCWQWHVAHQYTENVLLHSHCNNGYKRAARCYVLHTLHIWQLLSLLLVVSHLLPLDCYPGLFKRTSFTKVVINFIMKVRTMYQVPNFANLWMVEFLLFKFRSSKLFHSVLAHQVPTATSSNTMAL
jgi:hypothetical protein